MKKVLIFCALFWCSLGYAQDVVKPVQPNTVELFPLSDLRITAGLYQDIQGRGHQYLLSLEPDRLLSWFRREAGLTPNAQPYPLWESDDFQWTGPLAGHIMGFYMSSMSMMYQTTADPAVLDRLKYTVAGLKEVQELHGDGYLLATRRGREIFEDVVAGNFTTSNPVINDCWEPVYIMNKIMLGLCNVYKLCGIDDAKSVLINMADWFGHNVIDSLDHETIQKMLVCEHGSINESYVDVYRLTGDEKYLRWAERLNDEDMLIPLSQGKDILFGWHANTQIPKFTGFANVSRYNGDKGMWSAAELFWDIVVNNHTWINGGNSTGEHFFPESEFELKVPNNGGPESCNTVNMMRLTEYLYQTDGRADRIDYYERQLMNHILANFEPEQGMCCYYTSMRPGNYKVYATRYHSFWCCVGTGLEAPAKLAKMAYAQKGEQLLVNLYMPVDLNWRSAGITISQQTNFPNENQSLFVVKGSALSDKEIAFRVPKWIESGTMKIRVNGKTAKFNMNEDGYMVLSRKWMDGDEIKVTFTPKLEVHDLKGSERYYTVTYGPIVLAAKVDNKNLTHDDFRQVVHPVADIRIPMSDAPVLIGSTTDIKKAIRRVNSDDLKFTYASPLGENVELIPFNTIHFNRYALYMIHTNDIDEYKRTVLADPKGNAVNGIKGSAIDRVVIGDADSEQSHKMEFVNSWTGKVDNKSYWRRCYEGGYVMYNMRSLPEKQLAIYLKFRVSDQNQFAFDVLVDGRVVKSFSHLANETNLATTYYYEQFDIPFELTKEKSNITIKVDAKNHHEVAELLDIQLIAK